MEIATKAKMRFKMCFLRELIGRAYSTFLKVLCAIAKKIIQQSIRMRRKKNPSNIDKNIQEQFHLFAFGCWNGKKKEKYKC